MTEKKLSEIRKTLLGQHAEIRALIEETRAASGMWQRGEADYENLRRRLARLANAVRTHNATEEEALHSVLPTVDPWGPARRDVMLREHVAEHAELYGTLVDASIAVDRTTAADSIAKLLERMLEHMALEEGAFLGADVLTEEARGDGFGG